MDGYRLNRAFLVLIGFSFIANYIKQFKIYDTWFMFLVAVVFLAWQYLGIEGEYSNE